MKSDAQLWEICMNIYRAMYREAKPAADFDKLIKKGVTKKPNWFMKYYLPNKKQKEIIEEHFKKNKLTRIEKRKVSEEVWLGCAPDGGEWEDE